MSKSNIYKFETSTAILVDGGFYKKRANSLWGEKEPEERANELHDYCMKHLRDKYQNRNLYRILYYDCKPSQANVFNPITRKNVALGKTKDYEWSLKFLSELKKKRKLAIRLGELSSSELHYNIKYNKFKELINGKIQLSDLSENDVRLNIQQKGVDMKIGLDISSLALKRQVNQIILISGDSDFVPAAKQARREGIDFILDPMGATIKDELFEHIDGVRTPKMSQKSKKLDSIDK